MSAVWKPACGPSVRGPEPRSRELGRGGILDPRAPCALEDTMRKKISLLAAAAVLCCGPTFAQTVSFPGATVETNGFEFSLFWGLIHIRTGGGGAQGDERSDAWKDAEDALAAANENVAQALAAGALRAAATLSGAVADLAATKRNLSEPEDGEDDDTGGESGSGDSGGGDSGSE